MMATWPEVALESVCHQTAQRDPREAPDQQFRYVDISSVDRERKLILSPPLLTGRKAPSRARKEIQGGDVLVSTVRPNLNAVCLIPGDLDGEIASTAFCVLRPDPSRLNNRFLYYYALTSDFIAYLTKRATGANYPAVTDSIVRRAGLPLAPLAEQERIVKLLDAAEELRRLRAAADRRTADIIPALFDQMMGDPVKNPRNWPVFKLGEQLSLLEYGPRFYNEPYSDTGTRIVRITDIDSKGNLEFDSMPRLIIDPNVRKRRSLRPGDILFARSGATVGKTALIREGDPECIAGAYFLRLHFKSTVNPGFARLVLDHPSIQSIISRQSIQSAQQNFSGPGIRALPFPIPPSKLQERLANHVADVGALQALQSTSRRRLDDLFQSMLHRAFRGEL